MQNPDTNHLIIFYKGAKNKPWRKDSLSFTCRRMKPNPYFSPHSNIRSKYMKTLSVRPESLKLLEEKATQTQDMAQAEAFWVVPKRFPVTPEVMPTTGKYDSMRSMSFFYMSKETLIRWRDCLHSVMRSFPARYLTNNRIHKGFKEGGQKERKSQEKGWGEKWNIDCRAWRTWLSQSWTHTSHD